MGHVACEAQNGPYWPVSTRSDPVQSEGLCPAGHMGHIAVGLSLGTATVGAPVRRVCRGVCREVTRLHGSHAGYALTDPVSRPRSGVPRQLCGGGAAAAVDQYSVSCGTLEKSAKNASASERVPTIVVRANLYSAAGRGGGGLGHQRDRVLAQGAAPRSAGNASDDISPRPRPISASTPAAPAGAPGGCSRRPDMC